MAIGKQRDFISEGGEVEELGSLQSSRISQSEDSSAEIAERPSKRRRLSDSESPESDSFVRQRPFQTLSRIKKKSDSSSAQQNGHILEQPDPVTAKDALALGLRSTESSFASVGLAPWLVSSLSAMAIRRPTAIQRECIPEIIKGRDCIGGSRTGSGKTVAFAAPILHRWSEDPFGIFAVVLTPTRELALQIFEQFKAISAPQSLKPVLITGGSEMRPQAIALSTRPHVVIATPGRLADHINTSGKDTTCGLSRVRMVVLDEADRLLASGPGSMLPDVETCLSALPPSTSRQTLLFTATVTPEVRALTKMPRPKGHPPIFVTEISTESNSTVPPTLKQSYLQVPMTHREAFLHVLLSTEGNASKPAIIFCNRTKTADLLDRLLRRLGHRVTSLHSLLPQSERTSNLARFRASAARLLVATDVAARGLDIPSVSLVVNFDVPRNPDDYIHRVGRTARAGREGEAVTLVGQRDVQLVLATEARVGRELAPWEEEGVSIESRVVKGGILREVSGAKRDALGEIDEGKDVLGRRVKKLKKVR
ncbi:putative RNA helicase [Ophidiomyces ophidiicola]|uniref:RNA helicase n=1 Tax=Ophidiomyces ophidiicola TaxID=1387563 RepID=A0ACB8UUT9_9EURO|nr:putative RNA helicase [Ophidiomyces ophidiicola]KAI1911894.1 putative RNA helicase [Ophidiomyces ophidiicola]KAI1931312.1 putative RNA helicase [Ophidiomyces ophidiicola]KAI1949392.1 putative RNA helicase [Ophidiomyces ophidiicola]KAI1970493.1 putative RNA helicase [Ophidiomyces ophidiicola]